jgi:hypothetical protein
LPASIKLSSYLKLDAPLRRGQQRALPPDATSLQEFPSPHNGGLPRTRRFSVFRAGRFRPGAVTAGTPQIPANPQVVEI